MQRRILLLEEDATYAGDIRRGLSNLGFEVTLLRDGREGLARAVSEPFDLILLSAELPAINGFRICNRVKKDPNVGNVPLFLMGSTKQELATHGQLPTRADDYFTKPVVFDELVARMRLLGLVGGAVDLPGIAQARESLTAVAELESKVAEQEATIASLHGELATARAMATRLDAQTKELERLRAALAEAKRVANATPALAEAESSSAARETREQQTRALALVARSARDGKDGGGRNPLEALDRGGGAALPRDARPRRRARPRQAEEAARGQRRGQGPRSQAHRVPHRSPRAREARPREDARGGHGRQERSGSVASGERPGARGRA